MAAHPETKEPTSNETAPDDPNQECIATISHEFKPHLMPATEPPSEPPPHEIATSTSPLMTEPLLHQSDTPTTPQVTLPAPPHFPPHLLPDNWSHMSKRTKKHWLHRHKPI